jgi:hypothetical protein
MRAYHERKAVGEPSVRYRKPKDRRARQRRKGAAPLPSRRQRLGGWGDLPPAGLAPAAGFCPADCAWFCPVGISVSSLVG